MKIAFATLKGTHTVTYPEKGEKFNAKSTWKAIQHLKRWKRRQRAQALKRHHGNLLPFVNYRFKIINSDLFKNANS